ncbi:MAG: PIG-L family deacetylase, partial [Bacteroidota bacterium]
MTEAFTAVVAVAAGLGAVSAGLVAWGRLRVRAAWGEPVGDALVIAPHPDDDVILAGEYGIEAARRGRRVQVLYVTSGAAAGDEQRAALRRNEATAAWALAGVSPGNLTFVGAPSTDDMDRPIARAPAELSAIRQAMVRLLREASPATAAFIPASGESHVEHLLARALFIEAWQQSGRSDIAVLEGPEYNRFQSLVQCPARSLHRVLGQIPGVQRLWPASDSHLPGFTAGGPARSLPVDAARAELKRNMLRCFAAQNPDLLVRAFGHPDRFRRLAFLDRAREERLERRYLPVHGERLGPSVLLAVAALAAAAAAAGMGVVDAAARVLGPPAVAATGP